MEGEEVAPGDGVAAGDCQTDAVVRFAKLHDLVDRRRMAQEFRVGFRCDESALGRPAEE